METNQQQLSPEVLAAQKAYKQQKDRFKSDIKRLSEEQTCIKLNRKTVNFGTGLRKLESSDATRMVEINKVDLRHMYIAYNQFRTKYGGYTKLLPAVTLKQAEKINPQYLQEILKRYAPETVYLGQTGS